MNSVTATTLNAPTSTIAAACASDYLELLEFVDAIREDREPYIDVYACASWSSLVELSARSIDAGGSSEDIPDFTDGKWKERPA